MHDSGRISWILLVMNFINSDWWLLHQSYAKKKKKSTKIINLVYLFFVMSCDQLPRCMLDDTVFPAARFKYTLASALPFWSSSSELSPWLQSSGRPWIKLRWSVFCFKWTPFNRVSLTYHPGFSNLSVSSYANQWRLPSDSSTKVKATNWEMPERSLGTQRPANWFIVQSELGNH